jgi:hypothetical protein
MGGGSVQGRVHSEFDGMGTVRTQKLDTSDQRQRRRQPQLTGAASAGRDSERARSERRLPISFAGNELAARIT